MMSVAHNLTAINANRMFNITGGQVSKSTEKLSSGYRINRAADDAAGLAISEKMRRQIRGLTQASLNAQDGISLVQTCDGALNEVQDMLHRCNQLAIQGANGTLSDEDRAMLDTEAQLLKEAVDGVAQNVTFNDFRLFPDDGISPKDMGNVTTDHYDIRISLADGNVSVAGLDNPSGASSGSSSRAAGAGNVLADKIANELIPNAINQILNTFPALSTAVGSNRIDMGLDISYIDGYGNTLAYAQFSYSLDGQASNFLVKVDSKDFTDADAEGTGSRAEMLESTLAHELMHSVMQYTMTKDMVGIGGKEEFPIWFTEGTAQLSGGGFTTGWNDTLKILANSLSSENDDSKDADIANYLRRYTPGGRPYGHGYLATAYIGYLASGGGTVSDSAIASGINSVFSRILAGENFSQAVTACTGKTPSEIAGLFGSATESSPLTEFIRKLSYQSRNGAGSLITGGLGTGGTNILSDAAIANPAFYVDPNKINVNMESGGRQLSLQVGAEAGQMISVYLFQMDCKAIGMENLNLKTIPSCTEAIDTVKTALKYVSNVRSYYGATQNRLEHTIKNLDNVVENTTAAESQIRDTDMAREMVNYSNKQILLQAGQSMLSQANQQSDIVLSLLQ